MPLPVLLLLPDQTGYQVKAGHNVISTQLDGGASRFRADELNSAIILQVQWTMSAKNYNYLMAFYRTSTKFGALPFTVSLLLDSGSLQAYTANFLPDTFGLTAQAGDTYIVSASLEVQPNSTYAAGDAAIIAAGPDV